MQTLSGPLAAAQEEDIAVQHARRPRNIPRYAVYGPTRAPPRLGVYTLRWLGTLEDKTLMTHLAARSLALGQYRYDIATSDEHMGRHE